MKRPKHTDKQYTLSSGSECIKFDHKSYEADITRYIDKLEKELQKIVVIVLYKKEQMDMIESENKKLIASIEALLILVDSRLSILDAHEIGQKKTHIWNKVVENAQKLVKQSKS